MRRSSALVVSIAVLALVGAGFTVVDRGLAGDGVESGETLGFAGETADEGDGTPATAAGGGVHADHRADGVPTQREGQPEEAERDDGEDDGEDDGTDSEDDGEREKRKTARRTPARETTGRPVRRAPERKTLRRATETATARSEGRQKPETARATPERRETATTNQTTATRRLGKQTTAETRNRIENGRPATARTSGGNAPSGETGATNSKETTRVPVERTGGPRYSGIRRRTATPVRVRRARRRERRSESSPSRSATRWSTRESRSKSRLESRTPGTARDGSPRGCSSTARRSRPTRSGSEQVRLARSCSNSGSTSPASTRLRSATRQ